MKCKFCGEEMPEGSKFCPFCGLDDDPQDVQPDISPVTEKEMPTAEAEQDLTAPEEIPVSEAEQETDLQPKVRKWKRISVASGCVALMALLALVLFLGFQNGSDSSGWSMDRLVNMEIFRDNDIKKKDSYTLSDQKAQKKADTVVATLGDAELTNGQLQVYYQMEVIDFINNYSYYLSLVGLDYTKPLDEQTCYFDEELTWQQYFLEAALDTWQQYQTLELAAEKDNFQLESEMQEYLDKLETTMTELAVKEGYDNADAFMQAQCGSNVTLADYKYYMETYYTGYMYFGQYYTAVEKLTDEQLDAYFQENKETLESNGIKQDGSYTVDVRHILFKADGTENEDGTITFTDAEAAASAKAEAEKVLALWLENPTEENFAALAKEYTGDSNGEAGGLYEDVTEGYMVATFNDWCFDETRKVGDYGIVETRFGYHIMFFSARGEDTWKTETQSYYIGQQAQQWLTQILDSYHLDVDYSKISLAYVSLS